MVLLETGPHEHVPYGPFDDEASAEGFACYLTDEVDPAKAIEMRSPVMELLAYYRNFRKTARQTTTAADRPMYWPPSPGEIWQDRNGERWICSKVPYPNVSYLVCLARQADDNAEEIWRLVGPMTRVQFVAPTLGEEPPF
jgi:hypothetical protein